MRSVLISYHKHRVSCFMGLSGLHWSTKCRPVYSGLHFVVDRSTLFVDWSTFVCRPVYSGLQAVSNIVLIDFLYIHRKR